jgi:hypothetical protein
LGFGVKDFLWLMIVNRLDLFSARGSSSPFLSFLLLIPIIYSKGQGAEGRKRVNEEKAIRHREGGVPTSGKKGS